MREVCVELWVIEEGSDILFGRIRVGFRVSYILVVFRNKFIT